MIFYEGRYFEAPKLWNVSPESGSGNKFVAFVTLVDISELSSHLFSSEVVQVTFVQTHLHGCEHICKTSSRILTASGRATRKYKVNDSPS